MTCLLYVNFFFIIIINDVMNFNEIKKKNSSWVGLGSWIYDSIKRNVVYVIQL